MSHPKRIIFTCSIMFLFLTGCQEQKDDAHEATLLKEIDLRSTKLYQTEGKRFLQTVTVSTVGDILIHDRVYDDARIENGFDFSPMLQDVAPYLQEADLTIANQETMIGGEAMGLSGYPAFNSPFEVGDALKKAGVDVVTLANNHTLDRGPQAIMNALSYWDELDMIYTGAFKNREDANEIRIVEKGGISIAVLSYTYGTNDFPVPEGRNYLVNLANQDVMESQIQEASEQADAVLVALHAGEEYVDYPNNQQKEWIQMAADNGATAVIGHHPHVLQPAEWIKGKHDHDMLAIYSLGNFLSGQYEHPRRVGGIFSFELEMLDSEYAVATKPSFMPTYVQFERGDKNYKVTPMKDLSDDQLPDVADHLDIAEAHMSQWMPDLHIIRD